MGAIELAVVCAFVFVIPFVYYIGFRPPKGFYPNVERQGRFVSVVSTSLLKPLLILSGTSGVLTVLLHHAGYPSSTYVAAAAALISLVLITIPGALCYMQQIGGRLPRK